MKTMCQIPLNQILRFQEIRSISKTHLAQEARGNSGNLPRLAFSISETAEMLGVSERTIHRLIQRGKLKANKAIRHVKISKREIDRFLEREV